MFVQDICGHFDILMSQYGQVKKVLPFRAVPKDTSWRQQALSAILKQHLGGSGDVGECLVVSVCFCQRQLVHEWCLEDVLGVFGWCLWMFVVFGCVWGDIWDLIPCRWRIYTILAQPWKPRFFPLDILRRKNIKMSTYILNKNGWVLPFFSFLVPVRDKLKNTVTWITL